LAGKLKKYAFINAKLRARISRILPREFYDRMIRASSFQEAIGLFEDSQFHYVTTIYNQTGDIKMVERELFSREVRLYLELQDYLIGEVRSFAMALATFYEVENLKRTIRLWFDRSVRNRFIGDQVGYLFRDRIRHTLPIDAILNAGSFAQIVEIVRPTPYAVVLEKASMQVERLQSVFPAEVGLDHYFYRQLISEAKLLKGKDRELALRLIGVEIDIQNVNWIVRFKRNYDLPLEEAMDYVIPLGWNVEPDALRRAYSTGNQSEMLSDLLKKGFSSIQSVFSTETREIHSRLQLMESVLEQIMDQEVRRIMIGDPFTVGILLAYFALKRREIKNIVTILNGKNFDLSEDRIRSVLSF
jgi:V/A-type H+-transporting ATPase subunit C